MGKSKLKDSRSNVVLAVLLVGFVMSCASPPPRLASGDAGAGRLSAESWNVAADAKEEILTIKHKDLGIVVKDARLALREDGKLTRLSEWSVKSDKDMLTVNTKNPKDTTWKFKITDKWLDVSCSDGNSVVTGIAPASEGRIPARVKSQDNAVIYTSLGFVSAKNIYSLFDRKTDIMIQFPKESEVSRNDANNQLMDLIIPVGQGPELSLIPEYYTEKVGLARYQKTKFKPVYKPILERFKTTPTGWCSWYCYYMNTTEDDMIKETDVLAKELKPYGLEYVLLDACYTRGEQANWLEWYKKSFPKGGKWLFQYIGDKGLKPALWLNAYGANYAKPACADKYPENFFLRDKEGNLSGACCTADTTVVRLDYTNPEVIEKHLKPLFKTLVNDWGLEYLKDAGWGTWMDFYEENRENAYDPSVDSRQAYREVQSVIRDIMGPDNYINGCAMHEVGIGFGYFDGSRTGADDEALWYPKTESRGLSMQIFFDSLFGANYLNGIVWWSDPDVVMVRPPLTIDEAQTIVSSIALTGQHYLASDFMGKLSRARLELYKKTMPAMPITTIDLYPFMTEAVCCPRPAARPKALDLKVNAKSGIYDVVAVYNWSDEAVFKDISFEEDLGLCPEKKYLIYDFWNQRLARHGGPATARYAETRACRSREGIFKDKIRLEVPIHGVRVLVIRPFLSRPQLLATSRHITAGAFSVKSLAWDSSKFTLSGTSRTIPELPYSLFIYVPEKVTFSSVDANAEVLFHKITDGLLEVAFQGQETSINWTLNLRCKK